MKLTLPEAEVMLTTLVSSFSKLIAAGASPAIWPKFEPPKLTVLRVTVRAVASAESLILTRFV